MRRVLLVALALSLWACDGTFNTPIKREYTKPTVTITWKEVDSEVELNAACGRSGEDKKILGCAYISPESTSCLIYTYKGGSLDILGHEMLHCFTGRWHG